MPFRNPFCFLPRAVLTSKNHFASAVRSAAFALTMTGCLGTLAVVGCGGGDSDSAEAEKSPYAASVPSARVVDSDLSPDASDASQPAADPATAAAAMGQLAASSAAAPKQDLEVVTEVTAAEPANEAVASGKASGKQQKLRDDLSHDQLAEFLGEVDQQIQRTWSGRAGIEDPQQLESELKRVIRLKLEASRRLVDDLEADPELRNQGARGELQSLSHLAVLGDLSAAEELESLAQERLNSDDTRLATDSRLVLIGFAVEALQAGDEAAADRIVELVDGFSDETKSSDFPALMAMGQARQMLMQYGYEPQARAVRETIIDRFAGSPDPNVAQMTAQIAGNVKYDQIDKLLLAAVEGQPVSADQWQTAAEKLIDESADLQTVRYLAGAAIEFESLGLDELAVTTLETLANRFDDPSTATGREVELAVTAREARRQVIGRTFDPDLPGVAETPPDIKQYRGKVVLMPFWSTGFPDSLQLIDQLQSIRDDYPEQVAILGMNLDVAESSVDRFMKSQGYQFDSFHAVSTPNAAVANPVAARFGMVSFPFLVILDQRGNVAEIKLSDVGLRTAVEQLIANP